MSKDPDPPPVRELVFEYLERSEDEGSAVLEELCSRHPERASALRARVRVLGDSGLAALPAEETMPERLGEFSLIEPIGGGGMGLVFRARDDALGRDVAVKIVRPAELFFPGARERFEREVRTIARLAHPNIVPIYSVGEENGAPFFAMECVEGATLAEVLQRVKGGGKPATELTGADLAHAVGAKTGTAPPFAGSWTSVCAHLLRSVASALDHAHRHGVLHRDVKPSNVMLARDGRVLLFDFGISSDEDGVRLTRSGAAVGSLPYMAPELLEGDTGELDTRSDVYALGVTLYELLSLRQPFAASRLHVLRKEILDASPVPVERLNPRVSWELSTVVHTALDPDPERRYASAAAFDADLAALLDGLPIAARRAGAALRARRFVQRRPAASLAAALAFLLVVVGPIAFGLRERATRLDIEEKSRVIAGQERDLAERNRALLVARADLQTALTEAGVQRDEARAARALAEENYRDAMAAVDTLLARVAAETLAQVPGMTEVRRALFEDALAFFDGFLKERADDPELAHAKVDVLARAASLELNLGRGERAVARLEERLALLGELPDGAPRDVLRAETYGMLANAKSELGRHADAALDAGTAIEVYEAASALLPADPALALALAQSKVERGETLRDGGQYAAAEGELEAGLALLDGALLAEARDDQALGIRALAYEQLSFLASRDPKADDAALVRAEELLGAAIELRSELLDRSPGDPRRRWSAARAHANLSVVLTRRGQVEEAYVLCTAAIERLEELADDYPSVPDYLEDLATGHIALTNMELSRGRPADGLDHALAASSTLARLSAARPTDPDLAFRHAVSLSNLASLRLEVDPEGGAARAMDESAAALARIDEARLTAPARTDYAQVVYNATYIHAQACLALDDHAAAAAILVEALDADPPASEILWIAHYLSECFVAAEALGDDDALDAYEAAAAEAVARGLDEGATPEILRAEDFLDTLTSLPAVKALLDEAGG